MLLHLGRVIIIAELGLQIKCDQILQRIRRLGIFLLLGRYFLVF